MQGDGSKSHIVALLGIGVPLVSSRFKLACRATRKCHHSQRALPLLGLGLVRGFHFFFSSCSPRKDRLACSSSSRVASRFVSSALSVPVATVASFDSVIFGERVALAGALFYPPLLPPSVMELYIQPHRLYALLRGSRLGSPLAHTESELIFR